MEVPLAQHMVPEEFVRAGTGLPVHPHNPVTARRDARTQLGPTAEAAAHPVDLRQLVDRNLLQRIIVMNKNRQSIAADHELLWVLPGIGASFGSFFGLQVTAAVRDVDGAFHERRDALPGTAAGDLYGDAGVDFRIRFRPGLSQDQHRVGTADP